MIFYIFLLLIACFGLVLLFGAPYVPVHKKQAEIAIKMLNVRSGDKIYDLGCGDGRFVLMLANTNASIVGIELNPILFLIAKIRCAKYKNIKILFGSFWQYDLSDCDKVFVFLLDRFMKKLDYKLKKELKKGSLLASYTFKIPNKKIVAEEQGIYLYKY